MSCLTCHQPLQSNYSIKFCSKSCSATYNNKRRKRTQLTKNKTSNTLKKFYKEHPEIRKNKPSKPKIYQKIKICNFCKKEFLAKRNNNKSETWPVLCSNKCLIETKRKNARGNKTIKYKNYNFDSNWEKLIAIFLDQNNIKWLQPKEPIIWIDNKHKQRKYFPDFYLPKFNLYLDPKNPICCMQQKDKLENVSKQITLVYGDVDYIKNCVAGLEGFEPSTL